MVILFRGATLSNSCSIECDLADPDYRQAVCCFPGPHLGGREWVIGRLEWHVSSFIVCEWHVSSFIQCHQELIHSLFPIVDIAET